MSQVAVTNVLCFTCSPRTEQPPHLTQLAFHSPPITDMIRRNRQMILVLGKCVTSLTASTLLDKAWHITRRTRPVGHQLLALARPTRCDWSAEFKALVDDAVLKKHWMTIEVRREKNVNKTPVAERAKQDLEIKVLLQDLCIKFVHPMWTQRDQFSNNQLPVEDRQLTLMQCCM